MFGIGGIKSYLYIGLAFAVIALATMGFRWFVGVQATIQNQAEAIAELSIQKVALELEKASNESVIESLQLAMETQAEALSIVNGTFGEIRDEREQLKRVLEGSRLGRLAAERAQLIQERSNMATQELFEQFEGVINEDL